MATCADGTRGGDFLMRGEICSRILETLVFLPPLAIPRDSIDGGTSVGFTLALYTYLSMTKHIGRTCAMAPIPNGISSNSSHMVSNGLPSKACSTIILVAERPWALTLEWSFAI